MGTDETDKTFSGGALSKELSVDTATVLTSDSGSPHVTKTAFDIEGAPSRTLDGGRRAWSTVVGAWFLFAATFGNVSIFGVFEDYYVREYLSNYSASDIAWIGSVQVCLLHAVGLVAGKLFDDGYFHHLEIGGGILYIFSFFMLSLAEPQQYYQVFLAQGIGAGIGLGLVFLPAAAVISHHFDRRRALAVGIVYSGSSVGGVILPIMMNHLLPSVGFGTAVRALGGLLAGCLVVGNLLVRTNPPPKEDGSADAGPQPTFFSFLKDIPFLFMVIASGLVSLAFYIPIFFLQLDAVLHGVNPNFAFYLLPALYAASFPGRILPNFLADRFGIFNIQILCGFCCAAVVLGMLGINDSRPGPPLIIAIFYGFFTGALVSLTTPLIVAMSDNVNEIGMRIGLVFLSIGLASLLGSPIAGWLLTSHYDWWKATTFSAVLFVASAIVFLPARAKIARQKGSAFV
ncbi:MFS general substrate transporter [Exidia glandulosa HHB12029]|uniref:MFS general substrate transporter n=1 Tax=Exidia glandulosa HHB12029 TaxID=1314781 RepID=A0A166BHQ8_EXIGL|nr:MFS general substrate transporter [Exidia glandulosa HHB12029]